MALLMDLKVVKVGDIDAPPEERYLLPDTSTSESNEIAMDQFTWTPTSQLSRLSVYHTPDLVKHVSEELELREEGGAPDNWPQIPQLSRRRSCEASGERTNCVNKAVEHLQLLLYILTDWVQITEDKVSEDTDADPKLSIYDFDPEDKEGALALLTTDLVPLTSVEALKSYNNHAQLKAVVKEVMLLLAWLHDDCQKTEAKLYSEKALESQLSSKINEMSRQKIIDLKDGVQKEHESFNHENHESLARIRGLKGMRVRCQDKHKIVEKINLKWKKDIAMKNEQIPMVQDKMFLENQEIDDLQNALNEAEQIKSEALKKQAETDCKNEESLKIFNKEKYELEVELNAVCHEFNVAFYASENAKESYSEMSKAIAGGKQRIEDNERELMILRVRLDNHRTRSNSLQLLSQDTRGKLVHKLQKAEQQKSEMRKLDLEIKTKKNEFYTEISASEQERLRLELEFESFVDFNHSKEDSIDSKELKIKVCKKQKSFYDHDEKEVTDKNLASQSQVTFALNEVKRLQYSNEMLNCSEDQRQMKLLQRERGLQQTIDQIQRELVVENCIYLEVSTKINDMRFEVSTQNDDAEDEKEKYFFMVNDATEALEEPKERIRGLLLLKQQHKEELVDLEEEKIIMEEKYKKAIQDKEEYLANLVTFQKISVEKGNQLWKMLHEKKKHGKRIRSGIKIMFEEGKVLQAETINTEEEMEKLKEEIQELDFQLDATSKLYADTKARWEQVNERYCRERKGHKYLVRCRKETLEDILQKKQQSLEENEQLASKYRTAQNTLMQRKREYVQLSRDTIRLKQASKDLRQRLILQMKARHNNTYYYQYRSLYNSKMLAHFVSVSGGSQKKLKWLLSDFESQIKIMRTHLEAHSSSILQKRKSFLPRINQPTS